jgi:hypothetical protein
MGTREPRLAQAELMLRSHPGWSDELIAGQCKLSEAEVAEIRARLEAPCPAPR